MDQFPTNQDVTPDLPPAPEAGRHGIGRRVAIAVGALFLPVALEVADSSAEAPNRLDVRVAPADDGCVVWYDQDGQVQVTCPTTPTTKKPPTTAPKTTPPTTPRTTPPTTVPETSPPTTATPTTTSTVAETTTTAAASTTTTEAATTTTEYLPVIVDVSKLTGHLPDKGLDLGKLALAVGTLGTGGILFGLLRRKSKSEQGTKQSGHRHHGHRPLAGAGGGGGN